MGTKDHREYVITASRKSKGFQQTAALNASTALTVPAFARTAEIQAEVGDVRWRDDGVAPTAAVGMLLVAGQTLVYTGVLSNFLAIKAGGPASILNVTYYD